MTMQPSEQLFKQICDSHGIGCVRLKEGRTKTPDFLCEFNGLIVFAEVKELSLSKYDRELYNEFLDGGGVVFSTPLEAKLDKRYEQQVNNSEPIRREYRQG